MTKGGIRAFARALGAQLVDKGIRINAVLRGPVWTLPNPSGKSVEDVAKFGANTPIGDRRSDPLRDTIVAAMIAVIYLFFWTPDEASEILPES